MNTFRAVYMIRGPRTTFADQGPASTVTFFSNYGENITVWNLPLRLLQET